MRFTMRSRLSASLAGLIIEIVCTRSLASRNQHPPISSLSVILSQAKNLWNCAGSTSNAQVLRFAQDDNRSKAGHGSLATDHFSHRSSFDPLLVQLTLEDAFHIDAGRVNHVRIQF